MKKQIIIILILLLGLIFADHFCKDCSTQLCWYINWLVVEILWTCILLYSSWKITEHLLHKERVSNEIKNSKDYLEIFHHHIWFLKIYLSQAFEIPYHEFDFNELSIWSKELDELISFNNWDSNWIEILIDKINHIRDFIPILVREFQTKDHIDLKKKIMKLYFETIPDLLSQYQSLVDNNVEEIDLDFFNVKKHATIRHLNWTINLINDIISNGKYQEILSQTIYIKYDKDGNMTYE